MYQFWEYANFICLYLSQNNVDGRVEPDGGSKGGAKDGDKDGDKDGGKDGGSKDGAKDPANYRKTSHVDVDVSIMINTCMASFSSILGA